MDRNPTLKLDKPSNRGIINPKQPKKPEGKAPAPIWARMVNQEISINLVSGKVITGKLIRFYTYELELKETDTDHLTFINKGAIETVTFTPDREAG